MHYFFGKIIVVVVYYCRRKVAVLEVLEKHHMKEFFDSVNAICMEDLWVDCLLLKQRILNDIFEPEFSEETPQSMFGNECLSR